jgi:hypothetical protein
MSPELKSKQIGRAKIAETEAAHEYSAAGMKSFA